MNTYRVTTAGCLVAMHRRFTPAIHIRYVDWCRELLVLVLVLVLVHRMRQVSFWEVEAIELSLSEKRVREDLETKVQLSSW